MFQFSLFDVFQFLQHCLEIQNFERIKNRLMNKNQSLVKGKKSIRKFKKPKNFIKNFKKPIKKVQKNLKIDQKVKKNLKTDQEVQEI